VTEPSDSISAEALISDFFPPDWDDSQQREKQIKAVVHAFLTDTDRSESVGDRRREAQKIVADRFEVSEQTIDSKCGRETWKQYVEDE